jgi:metal-sulfur cluster biosynthetic enzyme
MDRLWAALQEVQDPEMPINLVDLGVIYGITERDGVVDVDLTFTAMGCPASDFIVDDVRERLLQEPGVDEVRVNVVWDPPWTTARMTEAGRDALEEWGLAV